jgi:hypothetical protein
LDVVYVKQGGVMKENTKKALKEITEKTLKEENFVDNIR